MEKPVSNGQVTVGDGVATIALGDTLIVLWLKGASPARWDWWIDQLRARGAQLQDGVLALVLITSESTPPDAALRKKMQMDFRELGAKLRKIVVVPLGNSIWQSIVRTIVRGTLLLSGESHRQVVASSTREALERIRLLAGPQTPNRTELTGGIDTLCKVLGITALEPS